MCLRPEVYCLDLWDRFSPATPVAEAVAVAEDWILHPEAAADCSDHLLSEDHQVLYIFRLLIRLGSHFIIAGIFFGSFDFFFTHFFSSHFVAFALKASFYCCPEAVFLPYIQQNIQQTIHSSFHFLTEKG